MWLEEEKDRMQDLRNEKDALSAEANRRARVEARRQRVLANREAAQQWLRLRAKRALEHCAAKDIAVDWLLWRADKAFLRVDAMVHSLVLAGVRF